MALIKQLVVLRRKAGMTKREFFNYHYQKHGAISTAPDPAETPTKYFQTHFVDAAYHADDSQKVPNAHPVWAFGDGMTELYFDSPEHMMRVFKSDWVVQKVGPDGVNFSDFSAVIPMFVTEVECVMKSSGGFGAKQMAGSTFVAMYFVAVRGQQQQHEPLISKFQSCLETYASQDVQKLVVNKPADVDFDLGAYFGGEDKFQYSFVFTITLDGENSIDRVREAQKHFEEECFSQLNLPATWIACGERAVVLDQVSNIKFDPSRQPLQGTLSSL